MTEGVAGQDELRVVLCNCPPDKAEAIAQAVMEARVAACVNVIPGVVSFYFWEGRLQRDGESTLLIKTRAGKLEALTRVLRGVHPYEVPEIIALPVLPGAGEPAYHAWVVAETQGA
jgi:periplasmic divalent cation tolerance protein